MPTFLLKSIFTVHTDNFNPLEYFRFFHFYEKYDKNKSYCSSMFLSDEFINVFYMYRFVWYTIIAKGIETEIHEYIVAEVQLDDKDIIELLPYCNCLYHSKYWFNPLKYYSSKKGCIGSKDPSQHNIVNAIHVNQSPNCFQLLCGLHASKED